MVFSRVDMKSSFLLKGGILYCQKEDDGWYLLGVCQVRQCEAGYLGSFQLQPML